MAHVDDAGGITFDTPFAMPGSVSLSLEAQGELTPFYADGIKYYVSSSNGGYEGDWELALVTDEFREKILKEIIDSNKVMLEKADAGVENFAFGFEIDGDARGTRFWFYFCTATRPTTESETTEDTIEPTTDTLTVSSAAVDLKGDGNMYVRAKTTADVDDGLYNTWFDKVYIPDQEAMLTSVVAVYKGSKTAGQTLDKSDFTVVAVMSNGTNQEVSDYTIAPETALEEGDNEITITYKEVSTTVKVNAGESS